MRKTDIEQIEKTIEYTFKNKALLIQAFTRRSFYNEARQTGNKTVECNEVLEFLGDSVLGCTVAEKLVGKNSRVDTAGGLHSKLDEGNFSVIKSNLSDKSMLSSRIHEMGLYRYFLLGEGDKRENVCEQPSVMEDLFESIVGAVFVDSGYDFATATTVVSGMLDIDRYLDANKNRKSPKTIIQEYAQSKENRYSFEYIDKGFDGPEHERRYFRALRMNGVEYPTAYGKNVKEAEVHAASLAIEKIGIH